MYYLKNTNFWMFGLFFFFYFFIMGAYFPFFPIWLHDINHISKSDTGINPQQVFAQPEFVRKQTKQRLE